MTFNSPISRYTVMWMSVAKKDVQHTSVLFIRTTKSPFSTLHISITTGPIYQIYIFYALHNNKSNLKEIG